MDAHRRIEFKFHATLPETPEESLNNTCGVWVGPVCGTVKSFEPCTKLMLLCNHRSGHLKTEHTESLLLLQRYLGKWSRSQCRVMVSNEWQRTFREGREPTVKWLDCSMYNASALYQFTTNGAPGPVSRMQSDRHAWCSCCLVHTDMAMDRTFKATSDNCNVNKACNWRYILVAACGWQNALLC
jgi:hypothetical protein